MTDGLDSGNRVGYVWVEFLRVTADGLEETYTCGVGVRTSASARSATAWHFVTDRRIGRDLSLEDDAGPLSMPRLKEVLGAEHVFEKSGDYKAHVGRSLFGLDPAAYDEVLRLLYWLRQPQVGEDIEPAKLAVQLSQALPQLDEQAVRAAGETFDELTAFGEQIDADRPQPQRWPSWPTRTAGTRVPCWPSGRAPWLRACAASGASALCGAPPGFVWSRSTPPASRPWPPATQPAPGSRPTPPRCVPSRTVRSSATSGVSVSLRNGPSTTPPLPARPSSAASRLRATVTQRDEAVAARARQSEERLAQQRERVCDLDQRQREAVPGRHAGPALLDGVRLTRLDQLPAVAAALDQCLVAVRGARSAASLRMAGLRLLRAALGRVADRATAQLQAEREAEQAESRWEAARRSGSVPSRRSRGNWRG